MVFQMTTRAAVKTALGITASTQDAAIDALLDAVSQEAANYLNRDIDASIARTQVYIVTAGHPYIWLRGYPIVSVTSVKYSRTRTFSDVIALDPAQPQYDVINASGEIFLRFECMTYLYDPAYVEVQYTGGMGIDTASFMAAYPRIANAVSSEIINRLNRAKTPDGDVRTIGGQVAYGKQLAPLDDFYCALGKERRLIP
jgi:hypothetical protein